MIGAGMPPPAVIRHYQGGNATLKHHGGNNTEQWSHWRSLVGTKLSQIKRLTAMNGGWGRTKVGTG